MLGQAYAVAPHVELVLGARPPQPGERLPEVRMLQQTRDRVRERLEVAGGHEQTAAAVIQRLRDAGDPRRDHRRAERHGFAQHVGQSVAHSIRGMHQDGRLAHDPLYLLELQPPAKAHARGNTELAGERAQGPALGTVPDDLDLHLQAAVLQEARSPQQVMTLSAYRSFSARYTGRRYRSVPACNQIEKGIGRSISRWNRYAQVAA